MKRFGVLPLSIAIALWTPVTLAIPPAHEITELPELEPAEHHQVASKRINSYFTRYHFKNMTLNDELSSQIHDRYLEVLDYGKMFLLKSDVEATEEYRTLFDDMINSGDLTIAYNLHDKALERRFERYRYALSLLDEDQPMDFSDGEDKYYYNREEASWPESEAELDELWRQRVKYDALNLKLAGKDWAETVETLGKRYNSTLKRLTQTNSEDVFQAVMNAFARSVEAHTSYLSPSNSERFQQNMNLSLEGIGAVLQSEYDYTIVRSLVPGGPADKNGGIGPDDKIIGVGQGDEKDNFVDVVGWRLDEVVELIKGPKGSTVRLQVLKASQGAGGTPKEITIVRDEVKLEDRAAKAEVRIPEEGEYQGRKMGVITIPGFYNNLTADVIDLIEDMQEEKVEGLIIDLRDNGGGALNEAISLSGLFIDKGPVVQVSDASGRVDVSADRDGRTYYDGPLTIMVNRYSASASEIFAAAMQDYGRAIVVGENTFGKGTVQQHRGLQRRFDFFSEPMGSVQYTVAKFYRIDGGSTQMKGVQPDINLPAYIDHEEFGESSEENALPWDSIKPAPYDMVAQPKPDRLKELQTLVDERIDENPEFKYVFADIERYREQHDKTWVSLSLAKRQQEQDEEDANRLTRMNDRLQRQGMEPVKELEELDDIDDEVLEADPYLDETIYLAFDLIEEKQLVLQ
ncbi:MAG: carboxy terminal-processing peptidase [Idiomarina sp.]